MKISSKLIAFLSLFGLIAGTFLLFQPTVDLKNASNSQEEHIVQTSDYWTTSAIEIDETNPTKDWSYTESTYDWCSGSGSWNDPYLIENVTIDATAGNGITIINSQLVYFVLRNCTIYNAGTSGTNAGIALSNTNNGTIDSCELYNNVNGIYALNSENNTIINNTIRDNTVNGIYVGTNTENDIYLNNFTDNILNGLELGSNNWDNGTIGNFWDDYTGYDTNGDGIGETAYTSGNIVDSYPICTTLDESSPIITINSPENNAKGGIVGISYDLTITDYLLNETWYRLNDSLVFSANVSCALSGTIDQVTWDSVSDGNITITFFANDTAGNLANASVLIEKDSEAPEITVVKPLDDAEYAWLAPRFELTIVELNLVAVWYTLDDDATIYDIDLDDLNGTIDLDVWEDVEDEGSMVIRFYARDEGGNVACVEVTVTKDTPPEDKDKDDTPANIFEEIWYFILGIFSFILGLFGLAIFLKRKSKCECLGEPDCKCSL